MQNKIDDGENQQLDHINFSTPTSHHQGIAAISQNKENQSDHTIFKRFRQLSKHLHFISMARAAEHQTS